MRSAKRAPRFTAYVASFETDERSAHRIAALVDEGCCGNGVAVEFVDNSGGSWRVAIHARAAPDQNEVRDLIAGAAGPAAADALRFERIAAKDWVKEGLAGLRPVEAGRFIVYGAHDRARIPLNRIGIEIEAALAFGTGHHGSTRGCLLALDEICKTLRNAHTPVHRHPEVLGAQRRASKGDGLGVGAGILRGSLRSHLRMTERGLPILDLGTGSGVLAIAAARALRQRVLATDVDAQAVRIARGNARRNGVGTMIEVIKADGVAGLRARAPFDLAFGNILLGPLQRLAAPLLRLTAPGARVILSGLLTAQANAAIAAYRPLALERRVNLDGWTTLVLRRRSCPRPAVARRRRHS